MFLTCFHLPNCIFTEHKLIKHAWQCQCALRTFVCSVNVVFFQKYQRTFKEKEQFWTDSFKLLQVARFWENSNNVRDSICLIMHKITVRVVSCLFLPRLPVQRQDRTPIYRWRTAVLPVMHLFICRVYAVFFWRKTY